MGTQVAQGFSKEFDKQVSEGTTSLAVVRSGSWLALPYSAAHCSCRLYPAGSAALRASYTAAIDALRQLRFSLVSSCPSLAGMLCLGWCHIPALPPDSGA